MECQHPIWFLNFWYPPYCDINNFICVKASDMHRSFYYSEKLGKLASTKLYAVTTGSFPAQRAAEEHIFSQATVPCFEILAHILYFNLQQYNQKQTPYSLLNASVWGITCIQESTLPIWNACLCSKCIHFPLLCENLSLLSLGRGNSKGKR